MISVKQEETLLIQSEKKDTVFYSEDQLLKSGKIINFGNGLFAFHEDLLPLFDAFDKLFISVLSQYGYQQRKYPVLLPLKTYLSTNYLRTSPQYAIFCSSVKPETLNSGQLYKKIDSDDALSLLKRPEFALSPSACFHLYEELRGCILTEPTIYTFQQHVFREEGIDNYSLYRFCDYSVREIVLIGDSDYVYLIREDILKKIAELLDALGLIFKIEIACDPFVLPEMQKYRKIQIANKVKYEVTIARSAHSYMACASLNLHGNLFAHSFDFRVKGISDTVSGCIGFGLERWIVAFLSQYGTTPKNWPELLRKYC